MNKLFMFLTRRHFFTLFFFLCLCENLWHGLWEMENKSLNPVCVNNRNVFSWSHIYNCYFGQTADGRIVNIPTSSPDRLSMPCFSENLLLSGLTLRRISGDCGCVWRSLSSIPFLSCCLLFLFLGPPCFLYPGSYLLCTPPRLPAVFPGTWSCDGSGSDSSWSWCQCCFLSRLARLAAAQARPLPRASPSLPARPAAAAAPRGGGLC